MLTSTQKDAKRNSERMSKVMHEKMHTRKIVCVLLSLLALSIAFILGFFLRSQVSLMQQLGIDVGEESSFNVLGKSTTSTATTSKTNVKNVYNSLSSRISEIEDIVTTMSLDNVDINKATEDAINAYIKSSGDKYAKYYSADDYSALISNNTNKDYTGIGCTLAEKDGECVVSDVFESSEAGIKGVSTGDIIKSINGNAKSWNYSETTQTIKNNKDRDIIITFAHPAAEGKSETTNYTITLKCRTYLQDNVTTRIDHEVGIITIHQFSDNTASIVRDKVKDMSASGVKSFVVDVRNNPGGYVTSALDTASVFVPSGVLVNVDTKDYSTARSASGETATNAPVSVIINNFTSGAAEVFACAMRDNQRAVCVGKTTAGRGTVQATRECSFGGAIRYTAAKYVTPSGNEIDGAGIKPDVVVENGETGDAQLDYAKDEASSRVK